MAPQAVYSSDDSDSEQTPNNRAKSVKKRRVSEYNATNEDSPRVPLKSVNINDDAAEKRRRRKSTKIHQLDTSELDQDPDSSRTMKHKQPLNAVGPTPVVNFNIVSSKYEEWMKMATDNKFNAANSWGNELINYFHEMSLLRNDTDNSINFQRASSTLDGCVKIWTSRVDSVGTETAKLASNLASGSIEEDEDEDEDENPDGDGTTQPKKKKVHRPGATLAKDIAQLQSKKLDLEFSVDPLFKKTCADFDEGGAHGLLMNHLSLGVGKYGCLTVVFDAGDSAAQDDEEEIADEPQEEVDLTFLRKDFFPDLSVLEDKAITHSLDDFSFANAASDEQTFFLDDTQPDIDDDGPSFTMDADGDGPPPVEDFFTGDNAVEYDYTIGAGAGADDYGGDDHSHGSVGPSEHDGTATGPFVPFDPRRVANEKELTLTMTEDNENSGLMEYLDKSVSQNWAGPEHWKIRRPIRRSEADPKAPKARKEKKEAFKIDFLTPSDRSLKEIADELFATSKASINLPGTSAKSKKKQDTEKKDNHTLPEDMHFSSQQLVSLFLKPKFKLQMRGHRADGELDESYWAKVAEANPDGPGGNLDEDGALAPFATQFFNDDFDDDGPGFDDVDPFGASVGAVDVDAGEQDLLASTQGQTRRVRPEFVNYAKRAKRVDVRKLKDNIWKGLDIVVSKPKKEGDEEMDVDDEPMPTDPADARTFSSVISGLETSYPRDKMDEISTSFCFICLLHLANEQGLKLQSSDDVESAIEEDERRVGNIWNLKVSRDPDAPEA